MGEKNAAVRALEKRIAKSAEFDTGTVIRFVSVSNAGVRYTYAALYAAGRWWLTGKGYYGATEFDTDAMIRILNGEDVGKVEVAATWVPVERRGERVARVRPERRSGWDPSMTDDLPEWDEPG